MLIIEKSWETGHYCVAGRLEFDTPFDPDFGYMKEQFWAIVFGWADPVEIE